MTDNLGELNRENSGAAIVLAIAFVLQPYLTNATLKEERSYYERKDLLDFWNSSKHLAGDNNILSVQVTKCNQGREYCRLGYVRFAEHYFPTVSIARRVHNLHKKIDRS